MEEATVGKKRLLMVHGQTWESIRKDRYIFARDVTSMVKMADKWEDTTHIDKWENVTPADCENYDFVILIMLPDQRIEKLNKYLDIVRKPGRSYKVICYLPDVVGWQMNPFLPENKLHFMNILSGSDYVMRFNTPDSVSYWKAVMRDGKSYFFERPYPVREAKSVNSLDLPSVDWLKGCGLDTGKKHIFIGKSLKNINEERNVLCSLYVARKIQDVTGWGVVCFANNPIEPETKDILYREICGLNDVVELPILRWIDYMNVLSMLDIPMGIYMDSLETRGQVALDCACARIPLVCSGSVAGHRLYPHTYVRNCRNVDRAVNYSMRVITEKGFGEKVTGYAYDNVEYYSFAESKARFEDILGVRL